MINTMLQAFIFQCLTSSPCWIHAWAGIAITTIISSSSSLGNRNWTVFGWHQGLTEEEEAPGTDQGWGLCSDPVQEELTWTFPSVTGPLMSTAESTALDRCCHAEKRCRDQERGSAFRMMWVTKKTIKMMKDKLTNLGWLCSLVIEESYSQILSAYPQTRN